MMEGFKNNEQHSSNSLENEMVIDVVHKRIEHQKSIYQPDPTTFLNEEGYDNKDIEREISITESLNKQWKENNSDFEQKNKKVSDVFEGIVVDQLCGAWLAHKGEAFFTAEPDDYLRKVDCVIEFYPDDESEKAEYLGLGIDVTFSSDYETVKNKLDYIWSKDVERGQQVSIKYVDTDNYKGKMDVCRTVLVVDKETVYQLARLYAGKKHEELDNHKYLANALAQIKYQLESYYYHAKLSGKGARYMSALTKTLSTFYKVYEEKEEFIKEHENELVHTEIFKTIQTYCDKKVKDVTSAENIDK